MNILAIDTSADETSAAVIDGRRVLSHVEYSQIPLHTQWGGIYPSLAKRAHEERIDMVIDTVVRKSLKSVKLPAYRQGKKAYTIEAHDRDSMFDHIDAIAVTYGPGLAIGLEVGISKAKELCKQYNLPLIPINHMEGHLYSAFVQNSKGNPKRPFAFPYLGLLVSGAHTELVKFTNHLTYEVLGATRDDAAGEALDKAARMLGFGYPGGAVIERLARDVKNKDIYHFPQPMLGSGNFEFSFSGLKTALLYKLKPMSDSERNSQLHYLASAFQEAVFQTLMKKTKQAIKKTGINQVVVGGGVSINQRLRIVLRTMVKKQQGSILFPPYAYLNGDNAAMIGIVAALRAQKGLIAQQRDRVDRVSRLSLTDSSI